MSWPLKMTVYNTSMEYFIPNKPHSACPGNLCGNQSVIPLPTKPAMPVQPIATLVAVPLPTPPPPIQGGILPVLPTRQPLQLYN